MTRVDMTMVGLRRVEGVMRSIVKGVDRGSLVRTEIGEGEFSCHDSGQRQRNDGVFGDDIIETTASVSSRCVVG
jgi:hypothetical protein